mmetsp:Transcript_20539/g.35049  ORF Transcript_20539/g.35049 Transcript_20539/m.35049 type:complete len:218 (+) Transcript_20539:57-710(+)
MSISKQVKLNIGGGNFRTTVATLSAYPDSVFTAMFRRVDELEKDEDGSIFIDRDPTHFRILLNWLREYSLGKQYTPTGLSPKEHQELLNEAEYYMLKPLVISLQNSKPPNSTIESSHFEKKRPVDNSYVNYTTPHVPPYIANQEIPSSSNCTASKPSLKSQPTTHKRQSTKVSLKIVEAVVCEHCDGLIPLRRYKEHSRKCNLRKSTTTRYKRYTYA